MLRHILVLSVTRFNAISGRAFYHNQRRMQLLFVMLLFFQSSGAVGISPRTWVRVVANPAEILTAGRFNRPTRCLDILDPLAPCLAFNHQIALES